jgi:hypothetical protein
MKNQIQQETTEATEKFSSASPFSLLAPVQRIFRVPRDADDAGLDRSAAGDGQRQLRVALVEAPPSQMNSAQPLSIVKTDPFQ